MPRNFKPSDLPNPIVLTAPENIEFLRRMEEQDAAAAKAKKPAAKKTAAAAAAKKTQTVLAPVTNAAARS